MHLGASGRGAWSRGRPRIFEQLGWARRDSSVALLEVGERSAVGSVIKKRRKRMAKKKHRKLLKKTRIQRRRQGK